MKKRYLLFLLIPLFIIGCQSDAESGVATQDDGTYLGESTHINFTGAATTFSKDTTTVPLNVATDDFYTEAGDYKYVYIPISAVQAAAGGGAVRVDMFQTCGIASPLTANGLTGILEIGTAEGYVDMAEAADSLTFYLMLPETFYDSGTAGDLILSWDLSEGAAASGTDTLDINIYEDGSETGLMLADELSMNATARAWVDGSDLGDDVSISGANKVLIVQVTPDSADDDVRIYGARLKYRPGIDTSE